MQLARTSCKSDVSSMRSRGVRQSSRKSWAMRGSAASSDVGRRRLGSQSHSSGSAVGAWFRWCSTQRPTMEASRVMMKMGSASASASHNEAAAAMRQQRDARLSQARAALAAIEMRVAAQVGRCSSARRRRTTARISAAVLRRRNLIRFPETSAPNQSAPHPSNRADRDAISSRPRSRSARWACRHCSSRSTTSRCSLAEHTKVWGRVG